MTNGDRPIEVLQLSDVHFGRDPGPVYGRDPEETLRAVLDDVAARELSPDCVVVTGDLVHDGSAEGYERLGRVLAALDVPTYCLAGNHDLATPFEAVLPRPGVHLERATRVGPWALVFLDSNTNGRSFATGRVADLPNRHIAAFEGAIHPAELAWLDDFLGATPADHVMVWLHHPPVTHPAYQGPERSELFDGLFEVIDRHDRVRAVAAGHLHCGFSATERGVQILACPSTWLVMDFDKGTEGPPAYRWHTLHPDGQVDSVVLSIDDPRYADGTPLPAWGFALIAGKMDLSALMEMDQDDIIAKLAVGDSSS